MYRLLIVEDDSVIRRGLRKIIEGMHFPIENILEAENGQNALAIYENFLPHIIITDIKMPLMDGLEFIATISNDGHGSAFIIVSGYDTFEYAKKAITYGVTDYLLKPVAKDELKTSLSKIIRKLDADADAKAKRMEEEKQYTEKIREFEKNLLWDIMSSQNTASELKRKITTLEQHNLWREYILVAGYGLHLSYEAFEALIMPFIPSESTFIGYQTSYRYFYALLPFPSPANGSASAIEQTVDELYHGLQCDEQKSNSHTPKIVLGFIPETRVLPQAFHACRTLLDARLLSPIKKDVQIIREFLPSIVNVEEIASISHPLKHAIDANDYVKIEKIIKEYFRTLVENNDCTTDTLVQQAKVIELSILAHKTTQYHYYEKLLNQLQSIEFLLSASQTVHDFTDAIVSRIITLTKNIRPSDNVTPVEQVLQYIERHYNKDITLVYAANLANMNTNYFSTLFKKRTGYSFVGYLQLTRIQHAKTLLKDPTLKIYEIAELTGFQNEKYFMKIFKKIVGKTPSEYKAG